MTKMRSPQKEVVPNPGIFQVPAIGTSGTSNNTNTSNKPPLHVTVPPKLTIPEQAHTSPTSRKSSDIHTELNDVLKSTPVPVSGEYQQRSASPVVGEHQEKEYNRRHIQKNITKWTISASHTATGTSSRKRASNIYVKIK